ncbi:hypothetical protein DQ239_08735 [Blastococcus sp. TF02-09]|uniref:ImmA/IrrE family metallo-endopeptidase n=1 Tax=Blastococcus sp. TF02-09 TaxID=2250576 RepID=UPI000DEB84D1|nr:ImmA/IrrE family metallo-endopeptidase [Blastococcus sp. TF02-9]RBY78612.1 hypothetical protein DQ239_08735 [Blastococcus sp. TF02-9]
MVTRAQMRHALQEADRLLADLDVDQEAPVDVFTIIDQMGLWLVFNRLDNLLGAVVPHGDGGVMLSTQRGAAVQRYTAAHEIAHWILDYGETTFDTADDVYHPTADREFLAQIFASQLLMPPPLVFAMCARYGIQDARTATPEVVYLLARDIGSSYEAAARQLANLEIITRSRRDALLKIRPATIKAELCRGHQPNGAVDVWPVGWDSAGAALSITEGDEVVVLLPENRTTGYRWLTDDDFRRRAGRTVRQPPPIQESDAVVADPDWLPSPPLHPTSAVAVGRALARVPGNTGAVRLLPPTEPSTPESTPPALTHPLAVVDDQFQAARRSVAASQRRAARRAIAQGGPPESGGDASAVRTGGGHDAVSIAGTGTRLLALRSVSEGRDAVELAYSSAYDPAAPTVETYRLEVEVVPSPDVLRRRALLSIDLDEDEQDTHDRE